MIKRYCDFCGTEIKDGNGDRRNEIIWHEIYEQKVDVCAECWDNCILGRIDGVKSIGCTATLPDGDEVVRRSAVEHILKCLPSAEQEPKKGKWEIYDYGYDGEDEYPIIRCSECEYFPPEDMDTYNFCPNCGADMRGGENEAD